MKAEFYIISCGRLFFRSWGAVVHKITYTNLQIFKAIEIVFHKETKQISNCKVNLITQENKKFEKWSKFTRFLFRYGVVKYEYPHQKLRVNTIKYCNIWCSSCFLGLVYFPDYIFNIFILFRPKLKIDFLCTPTYPSKLPVPNIFF